MASDLSDSAQSQSVESVESVECHFDEIWLQVRLEQFLAVLPIRGLHLIISQFLISSQYLKMFLALDEKVHTKRNDEYELFRSDRLHRYDIGINIWFEDWEQPCNPMSKCGFLRKFGNFEKGKKIHVLFYDSQFRVSNWIFDGVPDMWNFIFAGSICGGRSLAKALKTFLLVLVESSQRRGKKGFVKV